MTRILVIEDDAPLRDWLKQVLNHRGYDVQLSVDGIEGLSRLADASYDVLLLDLIMPRMSGFEVMTALEEKGIRIPTVITSGIVIPGVHDYLKTHPQVRLLSKPYSEEQLREVIEALAEASRRKKDP